MSKITNGRAAKQARRAARQGKRARDEMPAGMVAAMTKELTGHSDRDDPRFDRTGCPLNDRCAGCGATDRLLVELSYWPDADVVGCATICEGCEGRSFLDLPAVGGMAGMGRRIEAHSRHMPVSVA